MVVEPAKVDEVEVVTSASRMVYGRAAIKTLEMQERVPAQVFPSQLEEVVEVDRAALEMHQFDKELDLTSAMISPTELGSVLHQFYHVLLHKPQLKDRFMNHIAEKIPVDLIENMENQVNAFKLFSKNQLVGVSYRCEVPILNKSHEGSVVSGSIDLLLETEEGYLIIDHKSDYTGDLTEQFMHHLPQLDAYKNLVVLDKPVVGVGVNWIRYGKVTLTMG